MNLGEGELFQMAINGLRLAISQTIVVLHLVLKALKVAKFLASRTDMEITRQLAAIKMATFMWAQTAIFIAVEMMVGKSENQMVIGIR